MYFHKDCRCVYTMFPFPLKREGETFKFGRLYLIICLIVHFSVCLHNYTYSCLRYVLYSKFLPGPPTPNLWEKYPLYLYPTSFKTPHHLLKSPFSLLVFLVCYRTLFQDSRPPPPLSNSPSWSDTCFQQNNTIISEGPLESLLNYYSDGPTPLLKIWKENRSSIRKDQ